jgi:hypothetical protein
MSRTPMATWEIARIVMNRLRCHAWNDHLQRA